MQERNMPPFAPVLMQSTRAIGYSLEAAIADIIDNSIAAKAGKVQLSFFPVGDAYVSILDNGTGMDDSRIARIQELLERIVDLIEAMDLTVSIDIRDVKKKLTDLEKRSGYTLRTT